MPGDVIDDMLILVLDPDEAKDRGIDAAALKRRVPRELKPVISKLGTKTNSKKVIASILKPIEIAISNFAIEVLRGMKSFFCRHARRRSYTNASRIRTINSISTAIS